MIRGGSESGACLGLESDGGELQGWVLRYPDGALGMLHVEEPHRGRGYAAALLARATAALEARGAPCFAYIVDGNVPSERLFRRQQWERVAHADWCGFGAPAHQGGDEVRTDVCIEE